MSVLELTGAGALLLATWFVIYKVINEAIEWRGRQDARTAALNRIDTHLDGVQWTVDRLDYRLEQLYEELKAAEKAAEKPDGSSGR